MLTMNLTVSTKKTHGQSHVAKLEKIVVSKLFLTAFGFESESS